MRTTRTSLCAAVIAAFALVSAAGPARAADKVELSALVASNAQGAFTELISDFEKSHPNVTVKAQYLGGSTIGSMIDNGVPADIVLVGESVAKKVANSLEPPTPVLRNTDIIIVPKNNPKKIAGLQDLAKDGVRVSLATPASAVGTISSQVIQKAAAGGLGFDFVKKINDNAVKPEPEKGSDVVKAVTDGKADAAVVFQSDGDPAKFKVIEIPEKDNVVSTYIATVPKSAKNAAMGKEFVSMIAGSGGQAVLKKFRYMAPAAK